MYGYEQLIGRTIVSVRALTKEELDEMDWYGFAPVLVLDDGTEVTVSQDDEGNGPGRLFFDNPMVSS